MPVDPTPPCLSVFLKNNFNLFLAVLSLRCFAGLCQVVASGGYCVAAEQGLLRVVASPVGEHGL